MTYRCYLLDERDRISSVFEIRASSNADAIQQARSYAHEAREPFELWHGHALICQEPTSEHDGARLTTSPISRERPSDTDGKLTRISGRVAPMTTNQSTVLFVDDDPIFVYVVRRYFETEGYRVITANSAMAALEQWGKNIINIVITDVCLSLNGPDGGILLGKMLKHEFPDLPIIFVTAYPDHVHNRNDIPGRVFYKPVELSILQQVVEHSLAA